ncbi:MAG: hypothetical protein GIW95_02320 [Candidatus Eremiobacteraeota bacterium]|nr:hypothetical protein [Candidatus Eremiobacteraeota bacterium]
MEQLFRRIETYSTSPIERELAQCEVQLARLDARLQELPDLIARGKRVMFQMQRSRLQVQTAVKSASVVFNVAKAIFSPQPRRKPS